MSLAALVLKNHKSNNYNGKIESPKIIADGKTVLDCDLSKNISSSFSKSIIGPDFFLKIFLLELLQVLSGMVQK